MSPEERVAEDARPQHEVPYVHVRPPRRGVGVGGVDFDYPPSGISIRRHEMP